jgi:NAD(P)-dependent dehydrogenase (short-subunit alcohol dehydrogenase family)
MTKLPGINLFNLQGKTAIITGGSKGLGLAFAEGLASAGANVVLVARTLTECMEAAQSIETIYGTKALGLTADVTKEADMQLVVEQCLDTFGGLDILINSAGINIRGAIDEVSLEDFSKVMEVNVTGTWIASKAVVPHMKKQNSGKIINLASALGLVGLANRTPYTASKGAIVNMTKALAVELAPHNINVNAICPGPFLTEINAPIKDTEEGKKFIVGATVLGRWAEMQEIQGVGILLASAASNYMVGSIISVDGGWVAR